MSDFARAGFGELPKVHGLGFGHRLGAQALCSFISDEVLPTGSAWKWPLYERALSSGKLFSNAGTLLGGRANLCRRELREIATAAYIEWKYFSVLSPSFHGIVGFSLFNPKERFSHLAEGGMLVIVAGEVPPAVPGSVRHHHFVWMHLFASADVNFSEQESRAQDKSAVFHLRTDGVAECVSVSSNEGLDLHCKVGPAGVDPTWKTRPLLGTDVNGFPSGHWVVNNTIPVGNSSGRLSLSADLIGKLSSGGEHEPSSFWSPCREVHGADDRLATQGQTGKRRKRCAVGGPAEALAELDTAWNAAPAYFEHSWGLHPLPAQGWDFFFAPLPDGAGGAVLQSYKNSREMTRLDIWWKDQDTLQTRSTSFVSGQLSIDWCDPSFDRQMGAWLPAGRVLTGANERYRIVLSNPVRHTLPFLRPQTAAVRCFFIGEQIGSAHWSLHTLDGALVTEGRAERAGGEVAYARFPSLASKTNPFPVT